MNPIGPLSRIPLCLLVACILVVGPVHAQPAPATHDVLTPALSDTLRADQVANDNGFTTVTATGAPFTGIVVDTYASGAKKLRRSVVDGLPFGMWAEWYESGIPRYYASWNHGRGDGLWTYFHENGDVRERVSVLADVYHGLAEGWHATGHKAFEGRYRNGQKDGRWRRWDDTGTPTTVEVYRDGTRLHTTNQ
jgi:antitoxin component YwqK of YwqJK toxin-antitoxin module